MKDLKYCYDVSSCRLITLMYLLQTSTVNCCFTTPFLWGNILRLHDLLKAYMNFYHGFGHKDISSLIYHSYI
uniref:Uncharacterized protein n=1 Tax=Octopus bimaculoides TaxID=37653 RepID=A0A0L8GFL9_OCTBM